jgi:two-component sensor histidine kinase
MDIPSAQRLGKVMGKGEKLIAGLPLWRKSPIAQTTGTLVLFAISLGVRFIVGGVIPPGFPFVTFFPAVILSGFLFGVRNGAVAGVLCGIAAWWFFIAPTSQYDLTTGGVAAMMLYAFVVVTELCVIYLMQRAHGALVRERARCEALAASRGVMFNELQHRVSNNLQVAAGLLSLQRRRVGDPEAAAALDQATRRLGTIGRISRSLYDPNGAALGLDRLLSQLCNDVLDASGRENVTIAVTTEGVPTIEPDSAIPAALIVAEAVANAIEHGFAEGRGGRIDVRITQTKANLKVSVTDNGRGLPAGFDLSKTDSLGLRIATTLARQMNGQFSLSSGAETCAVLALSTQNPAT